MRHLKFPILILNPMPKEVTLKILDLKTEKEITSNCPLPKIITLRLRAENVRPLRTSNFSPPSRSIYFHLLSLALSPLSQHPLTHPSSLPGRGFLSLSKLDATSYPFSRVSCTADGMRPSSEADLVLYDLFPFSILFVAPTNHTGRQTGD